MNAQDKKKFIDVCVEITKYGKVETCSASEIDTVIQRVDETYVNGFEKFLHDKVDLPEFEDPDAWDNWYDNLTLEDIDERDIQVYDLPTEKIVVPLGNEEVFVKEMLTAAKEYMDACSFVNPKEDNFEYGYDFGPTGIFIWFVSRGDKMCANGKKKYNSNVRSKIDEKFTECINKFYSARSRFSEATGITFPTYVTVYRNQDFDPNCHTARCIYFTGEDLSNEGKVDLPKDYTYKFFRIVKDSKVIK